MLALAQLPRLRSLALEDSVCCNQLAALRLPALTRLRLARSSTASLPGPRVLQGFPSLQARPGAGVCGGLVCSPAAARCMHCWFAMRNTACRPCAAHT